MSKVVVFRTLDFFKAGSKNIMLWGERLKVFGIVFEVGKKKTKIIIMTYF
jgi:hypothetical protein